MFLKKQPPSSLLGIAFEGKSGHAALLRRSGGSLQVVETFKFELSDNPLNGDAAMLGAEIRKKLQEHRVRERRCAVCLPLNWVLTLQTRIPDMPEADVPAFLEIEAERHFPYALDAMFISHSRCRMPAGEQTAASVGVPRDQVLQLQQVLKAAQLNPLSFTLGIGAFQNPEDLADDALVILNLTGPSIELMITCSTGIVALRALEGSGDGEGGERRTGAEAVARELRITLGQVPAELRTKLKKVKVLGETAAAKAFVQEITPRLAALGLTAELETRCSGGVSDKIAECSEQANPALCLAARYLLGRKPIFEFLPPKTSAWKQLSTRVSSRKLIWAGATAGAAVLIICGAFFAQSWKYSNLRTQWAAMEPKFHELDEMQQNIKKYRPWFDESFRSLSILRKLTEAFPPDGSVTAKTVEIRDMSLVTCSGTARDSQAFLRVRDQLQASREITDVNSDVLRGRNPLQFQISFRWVEGGASENK